MPHLKNRQLQIPGGLSFYLAPIKWSAPKGGSFNSIVDALERVVKSNPFLAQKHKWPRDRKALEDWVDLYNATVCVRMGWTNYVGDESGSFSAPKVSAPHQRELLRSLGAAAARAKELVGGARTLKEWQDSGEPPVSPEQALARAQVCAACPHNTAGDLTAWFTVPASEYIKRQIERLHERQLSTPRDDDLHICNVCWCPLQLKVHTPLSWITKRLSSRTLAALQAVEKCWVPNEMKKP